ncbi:MAG: hypothetical protein RJQ08_03765 [Salinisphaeraceae bacterium]
MTQAIVTRFQGPTTFRGSRVIARCAGGAVTVSYDHSLDTYANHRAAAMALVDKLAWRRTDRQWAGGSLPDEAGFAFVEVPLA